MDNYNGQQQNIDDGENNNINHALELELEEQAKRDFLEGIKLDSELRKCKLTPNNYNCNVCNKHFIKEDAYNTHRLKQPCISQQNRTNCSRCYLFFATRAELVSHILTPEHRNGITNYINSVMTSKTNNTGAAAGSNPNSTTRAANIPAKIVNQKNPADEKKRKIMNKLDILNSVDFALNDEERTQIRSIVENSLTKNISISKSASTSAAKPKIPSMPDNTIKITYATGDVDVFENVRISSNSIINSNMPPLNLTSQIPNNFNGVVNKLPANTGAASQLTNLQLGKEVSKEVNKEVSKEVSKEVIKEPTKYQMQVLQFLKKYQNDKDRKGAFLKLLMKSQKKHEDAFDGFTTLINRVSGITPEAKTDYISVIADFEGFLIGLAARGQKTYNDMDIYRLVSLINGAK